MERIEPLIWRNEHDGEDTHLCLLRGVRQLHFIDSLLKVLKNVITILFQKLRRDRNCDARLNLNIIKLIWAYICHLRAYHDEKHDKWF